MFEVFSILLKWIKPILLFTVLAALISAGISLLLPNYYQSTVVFIPANPSLLDKALFQKEGGEKPIYPFGGNAEIDRVITMGESASLLGYAINQYKLYEHYEIDPNSRDAAYKVGERFRKNYSIKKNAQTAVELSVLDQDRQKAADWANDLAAKIDDMNREMLFGMKKNQIPILKEQVESRQKEVKMLNDSIRYLIETNPEDTVSITILMNILENTVDDYKNAKSNYEQTSNIINKKLETLHYFEKAVPSKRKTKPVRSLIVLGSTIFTFLIMATLAVFLEQFKKYQKEEGQHS